MADSTKSIIIGSIPVFRGEYTSDTNYYKENIVTSYSCVFKAALNNFSNVPPVNVDTDGKITIVNPTNWTCILDNTRLYNLAITYQGVDSELDPDSEKPVENKAIYERFKNIESGIANIGGSAVYIERFISEEVDPGTCEIGSFYYNTNTNKLYLNKEYEEPSPWATSYWEEIELEFNKLYINGDTLNWYRWNGERLIGINYGVTLLENIDDVCWQINNGDPVYYCVTDLVDGEHINIGTMKLISCGDQNEVAQVLETCYVLDDEGKIVKNESDTTSVRRYMRYYGVDGNASWTPWSDNANINIDKELNNESENPVANKTVSEKINELETMISNKGKVDILYFTGYTEEDDIVVNIIPYSGNSGSIVYVTKQDVFALYLNGTYYLEWKATDQRVASTEYNVWTDGAYHSRTDKLFYYMVSSDSTAINIDDTLDANSVNPVTNRALVKKFNDISMLDGTLTIDSLDENEVYHVSCNLTFNDIVNAIGSGRMVILGEENVIKASFIITQIPINYQNTTLGTAIVGNNTYKLLYSQNEFQIVRHSVQSSGGTDYIEPLIVTLEIGNYEDGIYSGTLNYTIGEIISAYDQGKIVRLVENNVFNLSVIVPQCPPSAATTDWTLCTIVNDGEILEVRYTSGTVYIQSITKSVEKDRQSILSAAGLRILPVDAIMSSSFTYNATEETYSGSEGALIVDLGSPSSIARILLAVDIDDGESIETYYYTEWTESDYRRASSVYDLKDIDNIIITWQDSQGIHLAKMNGIGGLNEIGSGASLSIDTELQSDSTNPVTNKAVYSAVETLKKKSINVICVRGSDYTAPDIGLYTTPEWEVGQFWYNPDDTDTSVLKICTSVSEDTPTFEQYTPVQGEVFSVVYEPGSLYMWNEETAELQEITSQTLYNNLNQALDSIDTLEGTVESLEKRIEALENPTATV